MCVKKWKVTLKYIVIYFAEIGSQNFEGQCLISLTHSSRSQHSDSQIQTWYKWIEVHQLHSIQRNKHCILVPSKYPLHVIQHCSVGASSVLLDSGVLWGCTRERVRAMPWICLSGAGLGTMGAFSTSRPAVGAVLWPGEEGELQHTAWLLELYADFQGLLFREDKI